MKKAQTTTEFMILMGVMMLIFIIFFTVIGQRMVRIQIDTNREKVKQFANLVTNEIILAQQVQNSYNRNFFIPDSIDGQEYSISMTRTDETDITKGVEIVIEYSGESYVKFVDGKINGTLRKGNNRIFKQNETIQIN